MLSINTQKSVFMNMYVSWDPVKYFNKTGIYCIGISLNFQKVLFTLIQKDVCKPMFTAALFIIAKILKQTEWLSMDEWKENATLLRHKKVEILTFASTSIDLEGIKLKWNKSDRESQILLRFHSYVVHKKQKRKQNKWTNQTKQPKHIDTKHRAVVTRGEYEGGWKG